MPERRELRATGVRGLGLVEGLLAGRREVLLRVVLADDFRDHQRVFDRVVRVGGEDAIGELVVAMAGVEPDREVGGRAHGRER